MGSQKVITRYSNELEDKRTTTILGPGYCTLDNRSHQHWCEGRSPLIDTLARAPLPKTTQTKQGNHHPLPHLIFQERILVRST